MSLRLFSMTMVAAALGIAPLVQAQSATSPSARRAMTLDDLLGFHRVSDPQVSPDGQRVAYVITDVVKDENRTNADIWIANADGSGSPRKLTNSPKQDRSPRWSPDGRWIAFESTRDGEQQIYLLPVDGGEARRLTTVAGGASRPRWSTDGRTLAFVASVYAEFSRQPYSEANRLNRERDEAREKSKVKARLFDELFYRRWDTWTEGKRDHLFIVPVTTEGAAAGDPRDVTPGENDGVPMSMTFSSNEDFALSPDGREIVTVMPPLPTREHAWNTNYDLWSIDLTTGERRNITAANAAADGYPSFSPDGRFLAYTAQRVPGFEADRWGLWLLDRATGERRQVTPGWDRSVSSYAWSADGKSLFIEAQENGAEPIFRVDLASGKVAPVVTGGVNSAVSVARDGRSLVFTKQHLVAPPEIVRFDLASGVVNPVTRANEGRLAEIAFTPPESVTVTGAGGAPVQMWIVKPPHFDPARKYPLVFWVHGGPQGAWMDSWSTRWNAEMWAAQGYVLALPNPRGSTGFGQKFTNDISRDWGGKVFDDLMACLAYMKKQPYVDASRMAAAGASYGGFMMNWFQGHVQGEFRCLVNHNGVFNFNTMYHTTDEIWFDEYEHGRPEDPGFEKFSPHRHTAKWSTPMMIIHSDLDFRCPVSEGMAAFTTLQRKGVRSKLLMFPDEGHWVLKPQNSERWHKEVFAWLAEFLSPER